MVRSIFAEITDVKRFLCFLMIRNTPAVPGITTKVSEAAVAVALAENQTDHICKMFTRRLLFMFSLLAVLSLYNHIIY